MLWGEYTCRIPLGSHLAPESENTQKKINFETPNAWNFNSNFPLPHMGFQSQMCLLSLSNIYRTGAVLYKVMSYNAYFQNNVLCSWTFSRQPFWFPIVTFIDKLCSCDLVHPLRHHLPISVEVVFTIYISDGQVVGGDGCLRENQSTGTTWDHHHWEIGQKGEEIKGMKLLIVQFRKIEMLLISIPFLIKLPPLKFLLLLYKSQLLSLVMSDINLFRIQDIK